MSQVDMDGQKESREAPLPWGYIPVFLIAAYAVIILIGCLGVGPLSGSEGRWAVIGRNMFRTGDIFNPVLGLVPYWDKPLVSYWQILPGAYILGTVNELVARLPSAMWALLLLFLTYDLARRWFGRESASMAAVVLSSTYGFVYWGRNAQVEMTNAAVIMLVLWYFFTRRSSRGYAWIFVLSLLMGIGANMKGLTAVGVPVFCIGLISLVNKDWKWFPPVKIAIPAALVLAAFTLAPSIIGCVLSSSWAPLEMIWKENVVRFFHPFDHKGAFYIYFYRIFDLAAPWSLLIPPALVYYIRGGRYREAGVRDSLLCFSAIFLFFTLSGSRRSYYLLPILPFTSLLAGDFLNRFIQRRLPPLIDSIIRDIGILAGIIFLLPLAVLMIKPHGLPPQTEIFIPWSIALAAGSAVMVWGFVKRNAAAMVAPVFLIWTAFAFAYIPWSAVHLENPRLETAKLKAMNRPVGFLADDDAKVVFYLDKPYVILPDLKKACEWADCTGGIVVAEHEIRDCRFIKVIGNNDWKAFITKGIAISRN